MAMTGVSRLFVDTNIIVYASDGLSVFNQIANDILTQARQQKTELIISSQILREYLSATTRSLAITGIPSLADIIKIF